MFGYLPGTFYEEIPIHICEIPAFLIKYESSSVCDLHIYGISKQVLKMIPKVLSVAICINPSKGSRGWPWIPYRQIVLNGPQIISLVGGVSGCFDCLRWRSYASLSMATCLCNFHGEFRECFFLKYHYAFDHSDFVVWNRCYIMMLLQLFFTM